MACNEAMDEYENDIACNEALNSHERRVSTGAYTSTQHTNNNYTFGNGCTVNLTVAAPTMPEPPPSFYRKHNLISSHSTISFPHNATHRSHHHVTHRISFIMPPIAHTM